jgi:hypothetical protein
VHVGWRFVELGFSMDNVFDVRNRSSEFHYASDFDAGGTSSMREARHFSAGAPRAFYVTLSLRSDMAWLTGGDE